MLFLKERKVIQLNKKAYLALFFVVIAIMGSAGIAGVAKASTQSSPVVVTNAYWYSQNSTLQVSPGSGYIPLFVEFTVAGSFSYVNVSVNLSVFPGTPMSYSYIHGPNQQVRSYYNLTYPTPGESMTIMQLVNISSSATNGVYEIALETSTNASPSAISFEPFYVSILGTPTLTLVNYFTDPPVIYQDEQFIQLTAVVSNTGIGPAKNFNVGVNSTAFNIMTGSYNISYFPSGSVENFTFLLSAHNITGNAPVTFWIGDTSYLLPLYLQSYGAISITSNIPTLTAGQSKALEEFNITNTGSKTLYDVNVHLSSPSVISVDIPSSNPLAALTASNFTIGELKPGQTATATFLVDVDSSAAVQAYPAQIIVAWKLNNTAQTFLKTYNFNEQVSQTTLQKVSSVLVFTPLNILVLCLIVALIIVIGALSARSRRKQRRGRSVPEKPKSE